MSKQMNGLNRFSKEVVIYGLTSGISKSLNFIFVPIFSRYYSEGEYGIIDLVSTLIIFLTLLSMLQLESAIGRYFYESKNAIEQKLNLSTALWSIVLSAIIVGVALYIFAPLVSQYITDSVDHKVLFYLVALILPIGNVYSFFVVLLRYLNNFYLFSLFTILQVVITFGVTVFLIYVLDYGVASVFLGQLISYFVVTLIMLGYFLKMKLVGFQWSRSVLSMYLKFSLPLIPATLFNWGNSYANRFVMVSQLGLVEIGFYTVAMKIASILKILEKGLKMTWGPFMYSSLKKTNHRETFKDIFRLLSSISFLMTIFLTSFSSEILGVLVPSTYYPSEPILILLFLCFGLNLLVQIVLIGPVITKRTHFNAVITFVSVTINIGSLLLLLTMDFGLISVPIGLFLGTCTQLFLAWYVTEKLYPIGYSVKFFVLPFLLTCVIVIILLSFKLTLLLRAMLMLFSSTVIISMNYRFFSKIGFARKFGTK